VHVGQRIATAVGRQAGDVEDVRAEDQHGPGRPPEVDRVHHHQRVDRVEQLLHQVDAADADVEDPHPAGHAPLQQLMGDDHAEAVVAPEQVADPRDQDLHAGRIRIVVDGLEAIEELERRLARLPAERYPVQHATAQFHLGVALVNAGRPAEAERALHVAARLFAPDRLPTEHAKATNALGAALRLAGRLDEAAAAFSRAAGEFEAAGLRLEQGAALFNLGLVQRELGDSDAAVASLQRARECLDPRRSPAEAAAAARELGATLLGVGRLDAARDALQAALALGRRAGDQAGIGAAANVLGLVELAADTPGKAADAFRTAVAGHPRSLRPGEFAMAKANLAVAWERAGDQARARLAAMQAAGTPAAAEPVLAQARGVLGRLGGWPGALVEVLDREPREQWLTMLREELARWLDAGPDERRAEAAAWIDGQLDRPAVAADLAEAWLGTLLELPGDAMDQVIRSALEALVERDEATGARFRSDISRALPRFHLPQWQRLADSFNRAAAELGQEPLWG
jgi:tetratricopeptide (TPR) repeat protein